jgi:hypothetical protein
MDNSQYLNPLDNESHSFLVLKNDQIFRQSRPNPYR